MPAPIALTGVPGTGKTAAATELRPVLRSVEVGELAVGWRVARRSAGGSLTVDLIRLARRFRRDPPDVDLVVGHLAHLLPVRDVIVLRCHPEALLRRLRRARRGSSWDQHENYVAEALDLVLAEAVRPGRRIWEVDTTDRSPAEVAHVVRRLVRQRPPSRYGRVDWLADRRVTAHLLPREP